MPLRGNLSAWAFNYACSRDDFLLQLSEAHSLARLLVGPETRGEEISGALLCSLSLMIHRDAASNWVCNALVAPEWRDSLSSFWHHNAALGVAGVHQWWLRALATYAFPEYGTSLEVCITGSVRVWRRVANYFPDFVCTGLKWNRINVLQINNGIFSQKD